jgi:LmbE family N-acetylglucosaminyl deacetylase
VRRAFAAVLLGIIGAAGSGWGQQLSPPGTGGVAALADALQQLGATKRVLVIGAHPDDENTQLLALLSRGMGVQTAYLSLSRGEGGQNLIGAELGPELGVIRTEELLAARSLDGARQYFTRAYDFGFSKSVDEAFRFWPRDSVLGDVLEVIRRFRPQILVSIFSGTPRDGHGQHQEAGILARQAFEALKDSSWGPVKLYRSAFFDTAGTTLTLRAGTLDPLLGQSYFQLAMAARSRHRSQDMGQLQRPGPNAVPLALVATRASGSAGEGSLFAGVDTVLHDRERFVALIDSARASLNPWRPGAIVPYLARALRELGGGPSDLEQRGILERALATAAGVAIDGVADDGIVIGGQRVQVELTVWNAGDSAIRVDSVAVGAPAAWVVERLDAAPSVMAAGAIVARRFVVIVPPDAPRSTPYFLRRPLAGALYDWSGVPPAWRGEPFEPPPLEARVRLTVAGQAITLSREVAFRYRDQGIGEIRRPLLVTRAFDLAIAPDEVVWPLDGGSARRFTVAVTSRARGPAATRIVFTVPRGWAPIPAESLGFQSEDETKSVTVTLAPPAGVRPGAYQLAVAALGVPLPALGRSSQGALVVIDYPHIRPRAVEHPSAVAIRAARIALPLLTRVGYVRGAADRVPEALSAVGVPLELIGPDSLAHGDLARYDAIVIGSRAYEIDPALAANNGRLLDYARGGGLVIVQYQQYPFVDGGFAPYRLSIARPHDRVTEETAAVTPLDAAHPLFHYPNAIGPDDWREWVQERGLYFAHDWDSTYAPLLETHDAGGPELKGGLLVAPLGRGTYVYTGLSFFRQLPAGVPGAYRLFANLLALKKPNVP